MSSIGTLGRKRTPLFFTLALTCACSGGGGGGTGGAMPVATATPTSAAATPVPNAVAYNETPMSARAFVDSMGVVVDTASLSSTQFPQVASLLKGMDLRHVRLPILNNDSTYDANVQSLLVNGGAKALGITNCAPPLGQNSAGDTTSADIQAFQSAIGDNLEAVEAINEPNARASADPSWASDTVSCMQTQTGALPSLPYLAPALSTPATDAYKLGSLASMVTAGNIHRYFFGNNPNYPGTGGADLCGDPNSLAWSICLAQVTAGKQPLYITETGYNSDSEVDLATQAKYISRLFFVNAGAGIVRTYVYTLLSYTGGDGFGGDGLLTTSLAPKPAYAAIASLTSAIDDSSLIAPVMSNVSYSIAGPSSLAHLLLRKRTNETYVLALWNETSSWNTSTKTDVAVPAQNVGVYLPFTPSALSAQSLNDSGALVSTPVTTTAKGFNVQIDDHVTLVSITQ